MTQNKKNPWVLVGEYTTLAVLLPASAVVGYLIGRLLDRWFTTNFLSIVFLILGIAAGFVQLIRQVRKNGGSE